MLTPEPPRAACTHSVEVPSHALGLALPIVSSTGAEDIAFRESSTWTLAPVVLGPENRGFQGAPNAAGLHTLEITALHNSQLSLSLPCFTAVHGSPLQIRRESQAGHRSEYPCVPAHFLAPCTWAVRQVAWLWAAHTADAHPVQTEAF